MNPHTIYSPDIKNPTIHSCNLPVERTKDCKTGYFKTTALFKNRKSIIRNIPGAGPDRFIPAVWPPQTYDMPPIAISVVKRTNSEILETVKSGKTC